MEAEPKIICLFSIALMWRGGCIIRSRFLGNIKAAYDKNSELDNLLLDDFFKNAINECQASWRKVIANAVQLGVPTPCFSTGNFFSYLHIDLGYLSYKNLSWQDDKKYFFVSTKTTKMTIPCTQHSSPSRIKPNLVSQHTGLVMEQISDYPTIRTESDYF